MTVTVCGPTTAVGAMLNLALICVSVGVETSLVTTSGPASTVEPLRFTPVRLTTSESRGMASAGVIGNTAGAGASLTVNTTALFTLVLAGVVIDNVRGPSAAVGPMLNFALINVSVGGRGCW